MRVAIVTGAAVVVVVVVVAGGAWRYRSRPAPIALVSSRLVDDAAAARAGAAWNGERAMNDIRALVRHAPRSPGTPGQANTLAYIERALADAGGIEVTRQSWTHHRDDGVDLPMTNVIGRWQPRQKTRLLLGTHHDSLRRAIADATSPDAPMPGANNSASGVALLLETARALRSGALAGIGVDFVFFDGEEGPYGLAGAQLPWWPVGSFHFADDLKQFYPDGPPVAIAIVDLVCRKDLLVSPEANSIAAAPSEVGRFWALGARTAPRIFKLTPVGAIHDDHSPFMRDGLAAFLVIDFRRTEWSNTTRDTIDKCSAESLADLGRTVMAYLHVARP